MSDYKFTSLIVCIGLACIGLFVWFASSVEDKTADSRRWHEQIHRRVVENCVNRGGVPVYDKWNGAVSDCVAVPK